MFIPSAIIAKTGTAPFTANALNFYNGGSGNNYLITSSLSGVSDSAFGSMSIWVRYTGFPYAGSTSFKAIAGASGRVFSVLQPDGSFSFVVYDNARANNFEFDSLTTLISDTNWHHYLISWDTNHAAGAKIGQIYLDDVNIQNSTTDSSTAFNVGYTAEVVTAFSSNAINQQIQLSEIWYAPGQFIDFSVSANRAKFSLGGHPISLGATGNLPTGVAPAVYLKNAAASAGTNSGTGGNFTAQGTITDTTPP